MSHHPVHYDYSPPPENYFLEESEGYPAEYSDSDCVPEHINIREVPRNMMKFYGRNAKVVPVQVVPCGRNLPKPHSEQFIQQSYYNSSPPSSYYPKNYEPLRDYYPVSTCCQHDNCLNLKPCRNVYNFEPYSPISPGKIVPDADYSRIPPRPSVKKFPVTFPTPKYYKKPPMNSLYRRASALCLPIATQPDPAVIRRPRKIPVFTDNTNEGAFTQQEVEENPMESPKKDKVKTINDFEIPHKVDSEGDVVVKTPNFDELFEQMEKGIISPNDCKKEMAKFARSLKPRMSASVRAKQAKLKSKIPKKIPTNINSDTVKNEINPRNPNNKPKEIPEETKQDVTESTTNSLEKLLNQLKKCEMAMEESNRTSTANKEKQEHRKESEHTKEDEKKHDGGGEDGINQTMLNINLNSLNYQDINENKKYKCELDDPKNTEPQTKQQINSMSNPSTTRPKLVSKPTMDDHCALELHRSKSYIVNLIDRALSKELGTIPSNRCYQDLDCPNTKRPFDLSSRLAEKSERDLQLHSSETESHLSTYTVEETVELMDDERSSLKSKLCHCGLDEPIYIKQLKKLRWGHLKHIQREVKRLEELERFLDTCSITTIPEV